MKLLAEIILDIFWIVLVVCMFGECIKDKIKDYKFKRNIKLFEEEQRQRIITNRQLRRNNK